MNKRGLIIGALLVVLALLQVGCSTASLTPTATAAKGETTANELAAGTLALEGTAQEVTTDQATELAFLWKAYASLLSSDGTATAELSAVLNQIQDSMTKEQLAAIEALNLTTADIQALANTYGISLVSSETSSDSGSNAGGGPGDMGGGGGDMGGMGGGDMSGVMIEGVGQAATTSGDAQMASGASGGTLTALIEGLVTVLEAKA